MKHDLKSEFAANAPSIYLVRHGEPWVYDLQWSMEVLNPYMTGRKRVGLTARGRREAKRVADFFSGRPIRRIYSSRFKRTRQTALETVEALGLDITILDSLGEINVGQMRPDSRMRHFFRILGSGRIQAHFPLFAYDLAVDSVKGIVASWYMFDWLRGRNIEGESILDAIGRIRDALDTMKKDSIDLGGPVVAFTHGYFIFWAAVLLLLGNRKADLMPYMKPLAVRSGSITKLGFDSDNERLKVLYVGRTRHLKK